ncbi:MAG: DUF3185 family protein [Sinobacterium sp.]|nr:DUF3185 family protein [Sinobacterium sp.]
MKNKQILGIVLLIVAAVVAYMGYSESQGLASSFSSAFNNQPSDNVVIKYIAAAVLAVAGIVVLKK